MRFTPLLTDIYNPGHSVPAIASAPLSMGQFVAVSGPGEDPNPSVTVAAPGTRAFGLAQDDTATGDIVSVQRGAGRCFLVPTSATIGAGQDIEVGEDGAPAPHTTGVVVAQAIFAAPAGYVALTLV